MKTHKVEEALFFGSDFKELPEDTIIFIKSGFIKLPSKKVKKNKVK